MLRIERQPVLQALQPIDEKPTQGVEDQERDGVGPPVHLSARIDSAEAIEQTLYSGPRAHGPDRAAVHDVRHVETERLHAKERDREIEGEKAQRLAGHQNFSGLNMA